MDNVDIAKVFYEAEEAEPVEEPTVDNVDESEPLEEVNSDDSEVEQEEAEETQEIEEDVLTLDGAEHNLEEVQEWKQAFDNARSMQADCTKKWQDAANLRKEAEAQIAENNELKLQLEVLIAEDEQVDMDELKEYDEVEYYKRKEKIEARKNKLAELKANELSSFDSELKSSQSRSKSSLFALFRMLSFLFIF